jgi:hypothetical protein
MKSNDVRKNVQKEIHIKFNLLREVTLGGICISNSLKHIKVQTEEKTIIIRQKKKQFKSVASYAK